MLKDRWIIYLAKSPSNKVYIGITSYTLEERIKQHFIYAKRRRICKFQKAIKKYGNLITFEVIEYVNSFEEALNKEIYYIDKFNSYHKGYNSTLGGEGKNTLTLEFIIKTARKFNSKSEWNDNSPSTYNAAKYKGIFEECVKHMLEHSLIYSNEQIIKTAKKFKQIKDWKVEDRPTYDAASRRGLLGICTKHMQRLKKRYSDEDLIKIAQQFNTVSEWLNQDKKSYNRAHERKLLKKCTQHMQKYGPRGY